MSDFDYDFESMMNYLFSPKSGEKVLNPLDVPFSKESLERISKITEFNTCFYFVEEVILRINRYADGSNSEYVEVIAKEIKDILINLLKEKRDKYEATYTEKENKNVGCEE